MKTEHDILERYLDGALNHAEEEQLSQWLASDAEAVDELVRACRLEQDLRVTKVSTESSFPLRAWLRPALIAAAAAVAIAVFLSQPRRQSSPNLVISEDVTKSELADVAPSPTNFSEVSEKSTGSEARPEASLLDMLNQCQIERIDWKDQPIPKAVQELEDEFRQYLQAKGDAREISFRIPPGASQEKHKGNLVNLDRRKLRLGDVLDYVAALDERQVIVKEKEVILEKTPQPSQEIVTESHEFPPDFLFFGQEPRPSKYDMHWEADPTGFTGAVNYTRLYHHSKQNDWNRSARGRLEQWGMIFPEKSSVLYDPLGPLPLSNTRANQLLAKAIVKLSVPAVSVDRYFRMEGYFVDMPANMKITGRSWWSGGVATYPRIGNEHPFGVESPRAIMPKVIAKAHQKSTMFLGSDIGSPKSKDFGSASIDIIAWPLGERIAVKGRANFAAEVDGRVRQQITDFQVAVKRTEAFLVGCKNPRDAKLRELVLSVIEVDSKGRPIP